MGVHVSRHGMPDRWLDEEETSDIEIDNIVVFERHHLYKQAAYLVDLEMARAVCKFPQQKIVGQVGILEMPVKVAKVRSARTCQDAVKAVFRHREALIQTGTLYEWKLPFYRDLCCIDKSMPYLTDDRNFVEGFREHVAGLCDYLREHPKYVDRLMEVGASRGEYILLTDEFRESIAEFEDFPEEFWVRQELDL
jgi:hypothetical protein